MAKAPISFFVVGLALFSMFFGSGNLIFPLFVGQLAQDQWMPAMLGFTCTAVLLPFLGIIAMVVYHGNYSHFFSNLLGKTGGFIVTFLLLTTWIPLGSGPRCIDLAHASLTSTFSSFPLWLFSAIYTALVWFVVAKKKRMIDILGKFLTPILLLCIALIVVLGFYAPPFSQLTSFNAFEMFNRGLLEGYNTMDMIASFFFSASIIEILRQSFKTESETLKHTFKACIVGIVTLAIVYLGLISVAATHSINLEGIRKDQLLVHIAKIVLGHELGFIASIAIILACFTTSVALTLVYADFLSEFVFKNRGKAFITLSLTLVACFMMSLTGLEGVTFATETLLQIFYPSLLIMILIQVPRRFFAKEKAISPTS